MGVWETGASSFIARYCKRAFKTNNREKAVTLMSRTIALIAAAVLCPALASKGWRRQQAIDYFRDKTGFEEAKAVAEVDRYLSWPGQALSYMVGQLKIMEYRERATRALGARFDLRRFYMVIIDSGQVPLDVLGQLVDEWIATEQPAKR